MPYIGEYADKSSHTDLLQNPDVQEFLEKCEYLRAPDDHELDDLLQRFIEAPQLDALDLPGGVIAIDGSLYESQLGERLPSTKVGYVKIGSVYIDLQEFHRLRPGDGRLVDPFAVAALQQRHDALSFTLPSANIRWNSQPTVRESFRLATDMHLRGANTRFRPSDPNSDLRSTLFWLASFRPDRQGPRQGTERMVLRECPICARRDVLLRDVPEPQHCPGCQGPVYPSDVLGLWKDVQEYQSNLGVLGRFMLYFEHLLLAHHLRNAAMCSLDGLADTAFIVDGPLALFDVGWMHSAMMRCIFELRQRLADRGLGPFIVIGLQKTGLLNDYGALVTEHIPPNRLFAVDDDYRYERILGGREHAGHGFGYQNYYGQDFIFKTSSEKMFVFNLPYPFATKETQRGFNSQKVELDRYSTLPRALQLIEHFETELYQNAVIPVALAHRYTAISLAPGGRVLDWMTARAMGG